MAQTLLPAEVPAIVLGAGPTGLALAGLLGRKGVETLLVERNATTSDIPKAIVLDDEGFRTIQAIGLAEEVRAGTIEGAGTQYRDGDGNLIAESGAGPREFGYCKRNFMSQPRLEATLAAGITGTSGVSLAFDTAVTGFEQTADGVTVSVSGPAGDQTIRTQWLLACDGAHSSTRNALGIGFEGDTYEQDWLVLDTENDEINTPGAIFSCDPARPSVHMPAPNNGRRYEFMLLDGEDREDMVRPETIAELLAPFQPYREENITRAAVYTFHARIADRLGEGRVLLLGDAAHLTPPFAGQGMNAGLRDASNVAWKIAAQIHGQASFDVLRSYEVERLEPVGAMIDLAVAMGEVIMPLGPRQLAIRDAMIAAWNRFPAVKEFMINMRFKPRPRLPDGLFVSTADEVPGSLVGEMIPQPRVHGPDGELMLDDLLGDGFAILVQDERTLQAVAQLRHHLLGALTPRLVQVDFNGHAPHRFVEPDIAQPLRAHRDQVLIIRPDRYAAGGAFPDQLSGLCDELAGSMGVRI